MKVVVKETIWRVYDIEETDENIVKEELPGTLKRLGATRMYSWLEPFMTSQEIDLESSIEIEPDFSQDGYPTVSIVDDEGNTIWNNGTRP